MRLKSQKGFTLVEAMMSAVLGGLTIVSVGLMLDNAIFMAKDNRSRIYATEAIRGELTTLRQTSFDSLPTTATFSNTLLNNLTNGSGTVTTSTSSLGTDVKKATITVSWTARNGTSKSMNFSTYICRKGINGS